MLCGLVLLVGCATAPGVTATEAEHSDATFDPHDDPFGWTPGDDSGRIEIGTLTVPVDYADPTKGTFELNIARQLALQPS